MNEAGEIKNGEQEKNENAATNQSINQVDYILFKMKI